MASPEPPAQRLLGALRLDGAGLALRHFAHVVDVAVDLAQVGGERLGAIFFNWKVIMRQKPFLKIALYVFLFTLFAGAASAQFLGGGPVPGSIYKEFTFTNDNSNWRVTDPDVDLVRWPAANAFLPNPTLNLSVDDLAGAISAEVVIDFWGGHEGTTDKKFRFNGFNGNAWITIPELDDPSICVTGPCPSPGNKYMQQLNHLIQVPLSDLIVGTNELEGTSGPNSWDWGQWGWYGTILRIYYNSGKPHADRPDNLHSIG